MDHFLIRIIFFPFLAFFSELSTFSLKRETFSSALCLSLAGFDIRMFAFVSHWVFLSFFALSLVFQDFCLKTKTTCILCKVICVIQVETPDPWWSKTISLIKISWSFTSQAHHPHLNFCSIILFGQLFDEKDIYWCKQSRVNRNSCFLILSYIETLFWCYISCISARF